MCIICVSPKGAPQPSLETLKTMFTNNPDGAGYMVARNGRVEIHKAFMDYADFIRNIEAEHFTDDDAVVYHCRICTQANVPEMTHPFPVTTKTYALKAWDVYADLGVAHNGIIPLTSNGNKEYSDTALYIRDYISRYVFTKGLSANVLKHIETEAGGRLAFLDKYGNTYMTGNWTCENGIYYSNLSYKFKYQTKYTARNFSLSHDDDYYDYCDDYYDDDCNLFDFYSKYVKKWYNNVKEK